MNLQKYQELKSRADELQREADKAQGALSELKRQLKKEFGCDTIKQAKALLEQLEAEQQQEEEVFSVALSEFEAQFGDALR